VPLITGLKPGVNERQNILVLRQSGKERCCLYRDLNLVHPVNPVYYYS